MAAAYLVDDRLDEAIVHGERGRAESQRIGDDEAAQRRDHAGSVLVFAGRMDEGWQLLEEAIAEAGQACQEAEAAHGYPWSDRPRQNWRNTTRERWLTEGVRYAENAELWNHRHYMAAHLAHVHRRLASGTRPRRPRRAPWRTGAVASPPGSPRNTFWAISRWAAVTGTPPAPLLARGARRRGAHGRAAAAVAAAVGPGRDRTVPAATTTRRSPGASAGTRRRPRSWTPPACSRTCSPACGRTWPAATVEAAGGVVRPGRRRAGRPAPSRGRCPRSATAGASSCSPAARFPRRTRRWSLARDVMAGAAPVLGGDLGPARPRGGRQPKPGAAARRPCSWTRPAPSPRRPGPALSPSDADRLTRSFGPGHSAEPWHPLSEREFEVAQLVAAGAHQPADRAAAGAGSPKTISAHVTHILTKLGAGRRAEIAAWCADRPAGPPSIERRDSRLPATSPGRPAGGWWAASGPGAIAAARTMAARCSRSGSGRRSGRRSGR